MDRKIRRNRRRPHWIVYLLCLASALAIGCDTEPPADESSKVVTAAPSAGEPHLGTIVAVGDSLTAGLGVPEEDAYPAQLGRKLAADGYDFKMVNAGVSGETSSGTLARIDWVIASLRPDIIILETGANDGLRGLDPGQLERNLDAVVATVKDKGIQVLLAGMRMLPNLGPEYTEAFAAVYPRVALRHGVRLIPFFLEGVAGDPRYNQSDRLHPTREGYRIIVSNIYDDVVEAIEAHRQKNR